MKTENKFTPGPWYVENNPDGRIGTRIRTESVRLQGATHGIQVARICRGMGYDQDEANARLISSAPELLDSLEMALTKAGYISGKIFDDNLDRQKMCALLGDITKSARAAIAKAKGLQ